MLLRTIRLRTWRRPTPHTIVVVTKRTSRPTQTLLPTLPTLHLTHFLQ